jgi:hypothetical protein
MELAQAHVTWKAAVLAPLNFSILQPELVSEMSCEDGRWMEQFQDGESEMKQDLTQTFSMVSKQWLPRTERVHTL